MKQKSRVYVIAEAGVNHNGSLETAKRLIDAAAAAGADAVKFQTFHTEQVMVPSAPKAAYQAEACGRDETQFEMVKKLELRSRDFEILKDYAKSRHIDFLSTAFDLESLDFLTETLNLPMIKIASGEITNAPFLLRAARTGRKILLSTGMCDLGEIEQALGVLAYGYLKDRAEPGVPCRNAFRAAYYSEAGSKILVKNVTLLHCTTEYPAPVQEANLRVIGTLRQCFGLSAGYSDHTPGIAVALAAAALGASVIEKHITLDRNQPGPDHRASLEPAELVQLLRGIRQIEQALGGTVKKPSPSELKNQKIARKGIVAARGIPKGERFTQENLTVKRPQEGQSAINYFDLLGKTAEKSYEENEVIL